jgi:hypothetical protein
MLKYRGKKGIIIYEIEFLRLDEGVRLFTIIIIGKTALFEP